MDTFDLHLLSFYRFDIRPLSTNDQVLNLLSRDPYSGLVQSDFLKHNSVTLQSEIKMKLYRTVWY